MNSLPELSVLVPKLPNKGRNIIFKAEDDALTLIAQELGVETTIRFRAELLARPWKRGGMALKGHVSLLVNQACVVTSEPVPEEIEFEIDRKFLPTGNTLYREQFNDEGEMVVDPDALDVPDEFTGDTIDLWQPLLEEVVLELNPFPRLPDAEISSEYRADETEMSEAEPTHNPFAELNTLINKKNSEN